MVIKDCRCIDSDDKHELSKAILTRINVYRNSIEKAETEEIIKVAVAKVIDKGEIEIKSSKQILYYRDIIERLENLYERLNDTPVC